MHWREKYIEQWRLPLSRPSKQNSLLKDLLNLPAYLLLRPLITIRTMLTGQKSIFINNKFSLKMRD